MYPERIALPLWSVVLALSVSAFGSMRLQNRNPIRETDMLTAFTEVLGNHPDYMADLTIAAPDKVSMKVAIKGNKSRQEWFNSSKSPQAVKGIYRTFVIRLPGLPVLEFDPQLKICAEMPSGTVPPDAMQAMMNQVKRDPELRVKVAKLGADTIDGHHCTRIRISPLSGGDPGDTVDFYVAEDLSGIVIKIEIGVPAFMGKKITYKLSNVSLDVPDDLFEPPSGYTTVDHKTFMEAFSRNTESRRPQTDQPVVGLKPPIVAPKPEPSKKPM